MPQVEDEFGEVIVQRDDTSQGVHLTTVLPFDVYPPAQPLVQLLTTLHLPFDLWVYGVGVIAANVPETR